MGLTISQTAYWASTSGVAIVILILLLRRRFFVSIPLFSAYIATIIATSLILLVVYSTFGVNSPQAAFIYWSLQAIQISLRAAAVYEISSLLLSSYVGVWHFCKGCLFGAVLVLLAVSAYSAGANSGNRFSGMVLAGERGLEITIAAILILGVAFCCYYRLPIPRHLALLGLGFGFYSLIQVANNTFLKDSSLSNFALWQGLRNSSFLIGALLWLAAVWKPMPFEHRTPFMLNKERYIEMAPEVSRRLVELNARLLEMWK